MFVSPHFVPALVFTCWHKVMFRCATEQLAYTVLSSFFLILFVSKPYLDTKKVCLWQKKINMALNTVCNQTMLNSGMYDEYFIFSLLWTMIMLYSMPSWTLDKSARIWRQRSKACRQTGIPFFANLQIVKWTFPIGLSGSVIVWQSPFAVITPPMDMLLGPNSCT